VYGAVGPCGQSAPYCYYVHLSLPLRPVRLLRTPWITFSAGASFIGAGPGFYGFYACF